LLAVFGMSEKIIKYYQIWLDIRKLENFSANSTSYPIRSRHEEGLFANHHYGQGTPIILSIGQKGLIA